MSVIQKTRINPYVGPRAFQYGETLHGREREVMELLDLLIAERVVLLYSPSGAGKTSLIQAALIPELEQEGFQVLPVMRVSLEPPPVEPAGNLSNRYVLSLILSLEETLPPGQQTPLAELAGMTLAEYLDRRLAAPDAADTEVLIFDQFEEILTVDPTNRAAKEEFFVQVGAALRDRHRWALFAMREEYLAGLDPYLRPLPTRLGNTYRLELLSKEATLDAIKKPARQAGVDFGPAAAEKLVDDLRRVRVQRPDGTTEEQLGPYVEPVQLQVVCYRLWEKLPTDMRAIEMVDIETVGDVDSALADHYAEQVKTIAIETKTAERSIRDWCGRQLVTKQGIRRQVSGEGLDRRAIDALGDAHLVRADERHGTIWFELAHDRLVKPIQQNNDDWYEHHLNILQYQAIQWEGQGRPASLLLRGEPLEEAERLAAAPWDELTPVEDTFLKACQAVEAVTQKERRRIRHLWLAIGAMLAAIVILMALYAASFSIELLVFLLQGIGFVSVIPLSYIVYRRNRAPLRRKYARDALSQLGIVQRAELEKILATESQFRPYFWPMLGTCAILLAFYAGSHPHFVQQGIWTRALESATGIFGLNDLSSRGIVAESFLFYGFLGAWIYSLQLVLRRFLTYDLTPSVYILIIYRLLLTLTIGTILGIGLVTFLTATGVSTSTNRVILSIVMFLIGFFPDKGLKWIVIKARQALQKDVPETVRLSDIDGLSLWHQDRLMEEGIDNVHALMTADMPILVMSTPFSAMQIVDWVDQSTLIVCASRTRFEVLRRMGFRLASDMLMVVGDSELLNQLAEATALSTDELRVLRLALRSAPNITTVSSFHSRSEKIARDRAEIATAELLRNREET